MQFCAQSPGHITGFFVIYKNGSTGAGLNVEGGMRTSVKPAEKDAFFLNGKKKRLEVSRAVLAIFREKFNVKGEVEVRHFTKFPIGYGLGISGAGALSLAICINKFFRLGLSRAHVTNIAKQAEIECGTGLGDVIAENHAGLMVGKKPYPSKGAQELKFAEKYVVLGFLRPIRTKKIIRSSAWTRKINRAGMQCMQEFLAKKTMRGFILQSRRFTLFSGLGTFAINRIIEKIPHASMAMLGETIFIPTNKPRQDAKELARYCKRVMVAKIAKKGARLL